MITDETIKKTGLIIENVNVVQPKAEIMKVQNVLLLSKGLLVSVRSLKTYLPAK